MLNNPCKFQLLTPNKYDHLTVNIDAKGEGSVTFAVFEAASREIAKQMNYISEEDLFAALGYGETTLNKVINKIQKPKEKTIENIEDKFHTSHRKKSEKDIVKIREIIL